MTKLKTLKDMRNFGRSQGKTGQDPSWIFTAELKEEAIKWVNDLMEEKKRCVPVGEKEDNMGFWYIQDIRADWIKHFFNLTEEDLKEKEDERG